MTAIFNKVKRLGQRLVNSKHMLWGVFVVSFLESILVPIPLEAILIPLMQIHRDKIWKLATSALAGCLLGACVGYSVGYFIFDLVGDHFVSLFSSQEQYQSVKATMSEQGFWFVFSVGVVPAWWHACHCRTIYLLVALVFIINYSSIKIKVLLMNTLF